MQENKTSEAIVSRPTNAEALSPIQEQERAVIVQMERRDEEQIIAEMEGEILDEFYYEVKVKGVTKRKMLYAGIKEVARRMGRIHIEEARVNEDDDGHYYRVQVIARDVERDYKTVAMVEQSKFIKHTDGRVERDEFALTKAIAKAKRNALRDLIPEAQMLKHINEWAAAKKSPAAKPVEAPAQAPVAQPASASKGARAAAIDTIKSYGERSPDHTARVWTIISMKGFSRENFPGLSEASDDVLAYILTEVQALIDAEVRMGKEPFKASGTLDLR